MNNKKIEKPQVDGENNFGIAFKLSKSYRKFDIYCHLIEKGKYMQRYCAQEIQDEGFARYMLRCVRSKWNSENKILRFSKNPELIELTPYCEVHTTEKLQEHKKIYQNMKKRNLEMAKKSELERKKKAELKRIKEEFENLAQKMKILQEQMEEMRK